MTVMNDNKPAFSPANLGGKASEVTQVTTAVNRLLGTVAELQDKVTVLTNDADRQERTLVKQDERIFVLEMEIEQLKSGNPIAKRADQIEKDVLDFMKAHPGMRLTPGIIYLNMPAERGYKSHNINNKLYTLANNGAIERLKDTGKVTVYWYKEEKI
jgi:uncharacterized small protein (DUF1192 family)